MANGGGGGMVEVGIDFIFLGSKVSVDGEAMKSEDIASWQESDDKPRQRVEKQRHYSANKGPYMVFPVVMYSCESWIIKKAEHQRIYAFELWCWRRLLRVP